MPRKRPISPREKAICRRLREFRLWTSFSQAELCALADLDARAYASYEYQRSQLNYPAAFKILRTFHVLDPVWLAEGSGKLGDSRVFELPEPAHFGPRTAFSQIYDLVLKSGLASAPVTHLRGSAPFSLFDYSTDVTGRQFSKDIFAAHLSRWIAGRSDAQVNEFVRDAFRKVAKVAARYPRDDEDIIRQRLSEMMTIERRRLSDEAKLMLTDASTDAKNETVKPILPALMARLRKVTTQPGKKTELAEFLGAPLASVSRWLSEDREPGGEIALQMQRWVEHQERKT